MNTESNIILATFAGMQKTDLGWFDSTEILNQYTWLQVGGNCHDKLFFDVSWDWLMAIVDKIQNIFYDCDDVGHDSPLWDDIETGLLALDIRHTYGAVLTFIKWYNKQ